MPLHWTICKAERLVIAVARGDVSSRELFEYMTELQEASAFAYSKIFDASAASDSIGDDTLRSLAGMVQQHAALRPVGPIAVVVANDEIQAKAEVYASVAVGRPIRIFRDQEEARRWIKSFGSTH